MMRLAVVALLPALLLGACREEEGRFALEGRIFVFNYRLAYAHYLVTLRPLRPPEAGMRYVARFENPAGGEPLVTERAIFPAQTKISIESPHVVCVRKGRPYKVTVEIQEATGRLVQTLETAVVSDLDQSVLPTRPLVEGPAYDRNDAAYGPDGAPVMTSLEGCPA